LHASDTASRKYAPDPATAKIFDAASSAVPGVGEKSARLVGRSPNVHSANCGVASRAHFF
jgi:hypothetical protein